MATETAPPQPDRTNQRLIRVVYYLSAHSEPDSEKMTGASRAQEFLASRGEFAGGYTEITDKGQTMRLVLLAYVDKAIADTGSFDSHLNRPVNRDYCGAGEVW